MSDGDETAGACLPDFNRLAVPHHKILHRHVVDFLLKTGVLFELAADPATLLHNNRRSLELIGVTLLPRIVVAAIAGDSHRIDPALLCDCGLRFPLLLCWLAAAEVVGYAFEAWIQTGLCYPRYVMGSTSVVVCTTLSLPFTRGLLWEH